MSSESLYFLSAAAQTFAALSAVVGTLYVFVSAHTLERLRYFKQQTWKALMDSGDIPNPPEQITLGDLHDIHAKLKQLPGDTDRKLSRLSRGIPLLKTVENIVTWRSRSAALLLITVFFHIGGIFLCLYYIRKGPDSWLFDSCAKEIFLSIMLVLPLLTFIWLLIGLPGERHLYWSPIFRNKNLDD